MKFIVHSMNQLHMLQNVQIPNRTSGDLSNPNCLDLNFFFYLLHVLYYRSLRQKAFSKQHVNLLAESFFSKTKIGW